MVVVTKTCSTQCYVALVTLVVRHGSHAPSFSTMPATSVFAIVVSYKDMGVSNPVDGRSRTGGRTGGGVWSWCRVKR